VAAELQEIQKSADEARDVEYVRPKIAADRMGITERQVYNKAKNGSLLSRKIDRRLHVAVPSSEVQEVVGTPGSELQEGTALGGSELREVVDHPASEVVGSPVGPSELPEAESDRSSEVQEVHRSEDTRTSESVGSDGLPRGGTVARDLEAELSRVAWERDLLTTRIEELREDRDTVRREFHDEREKWSAVVQQYSEEKERLLLLLSNEQALRLPQLAHPTSHEETDAAEEAQRPPDGAESSVTIRGSKRPGWLARLLGAR
jgi:hypothetical protein